MKKFRLLPNSFKYDKPLPIEYSIEKVTNEVVTDTHLSYMRDLINQFHSEYTWDGMFDINDVRERLKNKNTLYILLNDNVPVGYCFTSDGYLYNFYVSHKNPRTSDVPISFCCEILNDYISNESITVECENWNESAQNVVLTNYFEEYE